MEESWIVLILMAFALGMRHGFDLDHLAVIDGIARTIRHKTRLSRWTGFLFSLGHGIVVTAASLIIGSGLMQSQVPDWLEDLGAWISIAFLLLFGTLNLWNVFGNTPHSPGRIQSFLLKKLNHRKWTPGWILAIGALFAFSFDTFTQIALFSLSASLLAGWLFSGILAFVFMIGMMVTDGLNGLFISTVIQRADRASVVFSRGLGFLISAFSLFIGASGLLGRVLK